MNEQTEQVRNRWNRAARVYDQGERLQRLVMGDARARLCAQAEGSALEVAVGTGLNLGHYPPGVELTGVDLSPGMLARARARAAELGRQAELAVGDARDLSHADGSFDTVVCAMALCEIPGQRRALAEMWRVLRPGGRLLLVDHIEYTRWPFPALEARNELPRRRPRAVAAEVGFAIEDHGRTALGFVEHVVARRRDD